MVRFVFIHQKIERKKCKRKWCSKNSKSLPYEMKSDISKILGKGF